ncbi:AbaA OS=Streptomyces tendae OX=1932 GN=GUR47_04925 PE=4 SV=1 [Streptomyces tendae]
MSCRAQIIQLLKNIADARQWETTATAYPKLLNHRENPVAWERAARQAVRARRDGLERLMAEDDTEITRATTELARTLGD